MSAKAYKEQKLTKKQRGHQWGKLYGMLLKIREEEATALKQIWANELVDDNPRFTKLK